MAHSCAKHGEQLSAIGVEEIATADECDGLSASLKKGLPAIVCAVLAILECSIRRAYTWRERAAALELVSSLSVLPALSGSQRPLGENRVRVIRGCVSAKHDSVAAVREAAGRALAALGATEVEESQERKGLTGSWARSRGTGVTIADLKRTYRAKQEEISKEESSKKKKTLGATVNRAARENRDVDAEKCSVEKSEVAKDTLEKRVREKSAATKRRTYREHQGLKVDPDERAVLADVLNTPLSGAFSVEGGPEVPRAGGDDTRKGEIVLVQQEASWPLPDDNRGAHEEQKKVRRPWEISSSPVKDQSSRDPPPEGEIKRETQETRPVTEKEQRIAYDTKASPLEPTAHAPNSPVQVLTIVPEPLQAAAPPSTTASRAENATPKPEGGPDSAASTGSGGGECIPVPREGNIHVHTVRLLRHLNKKSDGISNILSRLDQRLLGLEKSLVVGTLFLPCFVGFT